MLHSTRIAPVVLASVIVSCAGRTGPSDGRAVQHPLVGTWYLVTEGPGERPSPGLRITLAVDSAGAAAFHGRLASFFSGDVGIDPRGYRPFVGAFVLPDSAVRLVIEPDQPSAQPIRLEGRLAGDSIAVSMLAFGRDTLHAARPLFLTRER